MSDRPSLRELSEAQLHFGLPSIVLVEKDWYVVKALAAIAATDTTPFRLVFGGGTALSRAHRLIHRMSEDIDLRIVADGTPPRSAYRRLREAVTEALLGAGFQFDPANPAHRASGNASRYTLFRLPYAPIAAGTGALRPEIQVETAVWPLRRAAVERAVISFMAEAFGRPAELPAVACVSLAETAAEKFVALTRRVGAELAGASGPRDPTLVRHLYDLRMLREHYDPAEVGALARQIMPADAEAYGHQFPAYRDDPLSETTRVVEDLAADHGFASHYTTFQRDMVYGEAVDYAACIATLRELIAHLQGRP